MKSTASSVCTQSVAESTKSQLDTKLKANQTKTQLRMLLKGIDHGKTPTDLNLNFREIGQSSRERILLNSAAVRRNSFIKRSAVLDE